MSKRNEQEFQAQQAQEAVQNQVNDTEFATETNFNNEAAKNEFARAKQDAEFAEENASGVISTGGGLNRNVNFDQATDKNAGE
jgi:glycerol dehydrogenase-like iron-containing ADH family enzyme